MRNFLKNNVKILSLIAVLLLVIVVSIVWCCQKSGFFIDEICAYGFANSSYLPYISMKDGGIVDGILTREMILEYLTVGKGDFFNFGSVYYNSETDWCSPLYSMFLNVFSSVVPGVFSKWIGLTMNLIFYVATLVFVYLICKKLNINHVWSLIAVLLCGLSTMGLAIMLYARIYALMTLLAVVLIYLVLSIGERKFYIYPLISLVIFMGAFTHYYYLILAFFICVGYVVLCLIKKEYKKMFIFSGFALLGVAIFLFAWGRALFGDLFSNTAKARMDPHFANVFDNFIRVAKQNVVAMVLVLAVVVVFCCKFKGNMQKIREDKSALQILLFVIAPFILSFIIISLFSLYAHERYVYFLTPMIYLVIAYLGQKVILSSSDLDEIKGNGVKVKKSIKAQVISMICFLLCATVLSCIIKPDYVFKEHGDYNDILSGYSSSSCVYIGKTTEFGGLTQDLMFLYNFEETFVTDNGSSPKLKEYLDNGEDKDKFILFIDVEHIDKDKEAVLKDVCDNMGVNSYEMLFAYGFSEAYVVTR